MQVFKAVTQIPKPYRFAMFTFLVLLAYWYWDNAISHAVGGWVMLLYALFPETFKTKIPADKTKNMLALLSREHDYLRVGMERVMLNKVCKVAIDTYNQQYAIISFPYTGKISGSYMFPVAQLEEVRAWFKTHTPELEIIT